MTKNNHKFLSAELFESNICSPQSSRLFCLSNDNLTVYVTNFGASVVAIYMPDKNGHLSNICLGYPSVDDYARGQSYLGAAVGPLAGRIKNGTFSMDDRSYHLPVNDGPNSLHSASLGISYKCWDVIASNMTSVSMQIMVPAAEGCFPANMKFTFSYTLTPENELIMNCMVTSDSPSPVNFTQHSYFNLTGEGSGDILRHLIAINSDEFLPLGEGMIPLGYKQQVHNTPMDLNEPVCIENRINDEYEQLKHAGGFDHFYILNKEKNEHSPDAVVSDPSSGRVMAVYTNQPGIQFYTGNYLDNTDSGINGKPFGYRGGLCLETQQYPDALNQPNFPVAYVMPHNPFHFLTRLKFYCL